MVITYFRLKMVRINTVSDEMTTIAILDGNAQFLKMLKRKLSVTVDDDLNVNDIVALMCATCDVDKMADMWNSNKGGEESMSTILLREQKAIADTVCCKN
jgi:hypothetical protein